MKRKERESNEVKRKGKGKDKMMRGGYQLPSLQAPSSSSIERGLFSAAPCRLHCGVDSSWLEDGGGMLVSFEGESRHSYATKTTPREYMRVYS